jgi:Tfp pilus assembly protein PilO
MSFQSRIDEYDKKEKKFIELEDNYKEWGKIEKTYAQFKESYLIKFYDYPDFRNELRSILSQNGLQLENMRHKYLNMMDDIRKVSLDLRLMGSYLNLKKFVYEMENKNKMILFKKFQINKRDALNVEAQISMEVYFVR